MRFFSFGLNAAFPFHCIKLPPLIYRMACYCWSGNTGSTGNRITVNHWRLQLAKHRDDCNERKFRRPFFRNYLPRSTDLGLEGVHQNSGGPGPFPPGCSHRKWEPPALRYSLSASTRKNDLAPIRSCSTTIWPRIHKISKLTGFSKKNRPRCLYYLHATIRNPRVPKYKYWGNERLPEEIHFRREQNFCPSIQVFSCEKPCFFRPKIPNRQNILANRHKTTVVSQTNGLSFSLWSVGNLIRVINTTVKQAVVDDARKKRAHSFHSIKRLK